MDVEVLPDMPRTVSWSSSTCAVGTGAVTWTGVLPDMSCTVSWSSSTGALGTGAVTWTGVLD